MVEGWGAVAAADIVKMTLSLLLLGYGNTIATPRHFLPLLPDNVTFGPQAPRRHDTPSVYGESTRWYHVPAVVDESRLLRYRYVIVTNTLSYYYIFGH